MASVQCSVGICLVSTSFLILLLMSWMMEKIMFPKSTGYMNMEREKGKKELKF